LALTSPTNGGRSVGTVRSQTLAAELFFPPQAVDACHFKNLHVVIKYFSLKKNAIKQLRLWSMALKGLMTQICSNIPASESIRRAERFAAALHSQRVDLLSWDVAACPLHPQGLRVARVDTRL
jgi:hypothetical protein